MDSEVFRKILPAEFHRRFLVKNRRADGRAFHSYRQPTVATNVLSNCIGSASVRCGNSYYLAGVRCEVGRPVEMQGIQSHCSESQLPSSYTEPGIRVLAADNNNSITPDHVPISNASTTFCTMGQVSVSVEFPKICGADFRDSGGPCSQVPLLVSGVVADLLNSPAVLDKRQLVFSYNTPATSMCTMRFVNSDSVKSGMKSDSLPENAAGATTPGREAGAGSFRVSENTFNDSAHGSGSSCAGYAVPQYAWHLFIHVLCLEYDGNPLDFAVLAAVAALEDTCLPGVFWDENAKWWRHLPPSPEQESPAGMISSGNSSSIGKLEGSNNTEATLCFIPARKVRLLERPVAVTFSHLLSAYWVVDPTKEEEALGCWLTICLIKDKWEITRFGGPPVKFEVLGTLKSVAGVIAKGIKRLVKVPNECA